MKPLLYVWLTALMALPSVAGAQIFTGTLADLDAATLKAMQERSNCTAARNEATQFVCAGLAAFARGSTVDATLIDGRRLIGVSAEVDKDGTVAPRMEVLAFLYRQARNFHESVMLGDQVTAIPVVPETADEIKDSAAAVAALLRGKQPSGNGTYEFGRTMPLEAKLGRTRNTTGISVGMGSKNRMLLRQDQKKIVLIELPFQNSHVQANRFWINVFEIK